MNLYLYKTGTAVPLLTIENVISYTADQAVTADGAVYGPFAGDCELSETADCAGTLRADWRKLRGPSTEERIAVLEEQLAQSDETAIALYEEQEAQAVINAQQDEALMEIYEMIG